LGLANAISFENRPLCQISRLKESSLLQKVNAKVFDGKIFEETLKSKKDGKLSEES